MKNRTKSLFNRETKGTDNDFAYEVELEEMLNARLLVMTTIFEGKELSPDERITAILANKEISLPNLGKAAHDAIFVELIAGMILFVEDRDGPTLEAIPEDVLQRSRAIFNAVLKARGVEGKAPVAGKTFSLVDKIGERALRAYNRLSQQRLVEGMSMSNDKAMFVDWLARWGATRANAAAFVNKLSAGGSFDENEMDYDLLNGAVAQKPAAKPEKRPAVEQTEGEEDPDGFYGSMPVGSGQLPEFAPSEIDNNYPAIEDVPHPVPLPKPAAVPAGPLSKKRTAPETAEVPFIDIMGAGRTAELHNTDTRYDAKSPVEYVSEGIPTDQYWAGGSVTANDYESPLADAAMTGYTPSLTLPTRGREQLEKADQALITDPNFARKNPEDIGPIRNGISRVAAVILEKFENEKVEGFNNETFDKQVQGANALDQGYLIEGANAFGKTFIEFIAAATLTLKGVKTHFLALEPGDSEKLKKHVIGDSGPTYSEIAALIGRKLNPDGKRIEFAFIDDLVAAYRQAREDGLRDIMKDIARQVRDALLNKNTIPVMSPTTRGHLPYEFKDSPYNGDIRQGIEKLVEGKPIADEVDEYMQLEATYIGSLSATPRDNKMLSQLAKQLKKMFNNTVIPGVFDARGKEFAQEFSKTRKGEEAKQVNEELQKQYKNKTVIQMAKGKDDLRKRYDHERILWDQRELKPGSMTGKSDLLPSKAVYKAFDLPEAVVVSALRGLVLDTEQNFAARVVDGKRQLVPIRRDGGALPRQTAPFAEVYMATLKYNMEHDKKDWLDPDDIPVSIETSYENSILEPLSSTEIVGATAALTGAEPMAMFKTGAKGIVSLTKESNFYRQVRLSGIDNDVLNILEAKGYVLKNGQGFL
ncbi:MAG: hypothetical protein HY591_03895, partial [Candidatus Omnitrophica bacterium]|nr:hypothetical protein [Candidatus Omnitrophota bacterium]